MRIALCAVVLLTASAYLCNERANAIAREDAAQWAALGEELVTWGCGVGGSFEEEQYRDASFWLGALAVAAAVGLVVWIAEPSNACVPETESTPGFEWLSRYGADEQAASEPLSQAALSALAAAGIGFVAGAALGAVAISLPALWRPDYLYGFVSFDERRHPPTSLSADVAVLGAWLGGAVGAMVGWVVGSIRRGPSRAKRFVAAGVVFVLFLLVGPARCR